jgi:hypothetical protein
MPWNTPLAPLQFGSVKLTQDCDDGTQHAPLHELELHVTPAPRNVPFCAAQFAAVCVLQTPLMQQAPFGCGQFTPEHVVLLPWYVPPCCEHWVVVWPPTQFPFGRQRAPVTAAQSTTARITKSPLTPKEQLLNQALGGIAKIAFFCD